MSAGWDTATGMLNAAKEEIDTGDHEEADRLLVEAEHFLASCEAGSVENR